MHRCLIAFVLCFALLLTSVAHASDDYVSDDDDVPRRPRVGLIIGGAITFGVSWVPTALAALVIGTGDQCDDCDAAAGVLWIPVVGPLLALAVSDNAQDGAEGIAVLSLISLAQGVGATLLTLGIIGTEDPDYLGMQLGDGVTLSASPYATPESQGMAFELRF